MVGANTAAGSASAVPSSSSNTGPTEQELSCTTCLTNFKTKEEKRVHMRDDWHVYNLKRRIASLPPISLSVFQSQVVPNYKSDDSDSSSTSSPFSESCTACEQRYTNPKAWHAHLKSRNHIQKSALVASIDVLSLSDSEDVDDLQSEEVAFDPWKCLFCSAQSASLESNLAHMSKAHSFFIPDVEYLIDTESFLGYLFAVISQFHECLFCGSEKGSKFAVQAHMRGKGHCKVDLERDENELEQFYDFSGEPVSDEEDEGEEQDGKQKILIADDDELRLPSGKTLGHRSRTRVFRKNHIPRAPSATSSQQPIESSSTSDPSNPDSTPIEPQPTNQDKQLALALRAGTSTSLVGLSLPQQRALLAVEKKQMKLEIRARNEYQSGVERGGNRQKRFKVCSIGKKAGGLEKRLG
ncbi:C2H2 type zinc-finger-domain-containing protein [Tricladium varicosporioides]|nr:C2H2 type zinc-finger-domain-containing protein [Hymenoscyphus varicosporioides]